MRGQKNHAMKQVKVILALSAAMLWGACTSNPSKGNAVEGSNATDSTEVTRQDSDSIAQESYSLDFSLKNLLVLMKQVEDFEQSETSGLDFIYEDSSHDEEMDYIIYVYGRGVEKGEKDDFGYKIKATSPHGLYFTYSLDTSQQANLYFASEDDAKQFIEGLLKQVPVEFNGKTYYVHPKKHDDGQHLYIELPYGDDGDDYSTEFEIYPPRMEDGFCRLEIGVYV